MHKTIRIDRIYDNGRRQQFSIDGESYSAESFKKEAQGVQILLNLLSFLVVRICSFVNLILSEDSPNF